MRQVIYVCDMCHKVMLNYYYDNTFAQYCWQCFEKLKCDMQLKTFTPTTEKSTEVIKENLITEQTNKSEDYMRADEPIKKFDLYTMRDANYINQLRYERLMAKAYYYRLMMSDYVDRYTMSQAVSKYTRKKFEQCQRIAEALEARARRIKEGM